MKTVRRLFYRDILSSVGFVAAAFLSLFYFIDFVDGLDDIGRRGRAVWHVALSALYEVPGHLYELLPIAVLIGTIYSLARMAQASEYTILRTGARHHTTERRVRGWVQPLPVAAPQPSKWRSRQRRAQGGRAKARLSSALGPASRSSGMLRPTQPPLLRR